MKITDPQLTTATEKKEVKPNNEQCWFSKYGCRLDYTRASKNLLHMEIRIYKI